MAVTDPVDVRLLAALAEAGKAAVHELAAKVGLDPREVAYRLVSLSGSGLPLLVGVESDPAGLRAAIAGATGSLPQVPSSGGPGAWSGPGQPGTVGGQGVAGAMAPSGPMPFAQPGQAGQPMPPGAHPGAATGQPMPSGPLPNAQPGYGRQAMPSGAIPAAPGAAGAQAMPSGAIPGAAGGQAMPSGGVAAAAGWAGPVHPGAAGPGGQPLAGTGGVPAVQGGGSGPYGAPSGPYGVASGQVAQPQHQQQQPQQHQQLHYQHSPAPDLVLSTWGVPQTAAWARGDEQHRGSAASGAKGRVGDKLPAQGLEGEQLTVQLLEVQDPADFLFGAAGYRLEEGERAVVVHTEITNRGGIPFAALPDHYLELVTADGATVAKAPVALTSRPPHRIGVRPGETLGGHTVYVLPEATRVVAVRWSPRPEPDERSLTWTVEG